MNIWEKLQRIVEAGPFGSSNSPTPSSLSHPTPAPVGGAKGGAVRNVQMTDQEVDAVLAVIEMSKERNVKGVDLDALDQKLYGAKVRKESMGSGNSTSQADAGDIESEVEGSY